MLLLGVVKRGFCLKEYAAGESAFHSRGAKTRSQDIRPISPQVK